MHNATKAYAYELEWSKFQAFLQRVERSQRKREDDARLEHKKKNSPYLETKP